MPVTDVSFHATIVAMQGQHLINNSFAGCGIDRSSYTQLDKQLNPYDISIKYAVKGSEYYELDGKKCAVPAGRYLITNCQNIRGVLDSKTEVPGICAALSFDLMAQCTSFAVDDNISVEKLIAYFKTKDFFEHVYTKDSGTLGSHLAHLRRTISDTENASIAKAETMLTLAEEFLYDQAAHFRNLSSIQAVKWATKKDLYQRLLLARSYMQEHLAADMDMNEIASIAHLSVYHFFKLFKAAFGISPYQYRQKARIAKSKELLVTGMSVTDTALSCGFNDASTFSKVFKQKEGLSPLAYQLANA